MLNIYLKTFCGFDKLYELCKVELMNKGAGCAGVPVWFRLRPACMSRNNLDNQKTKTYLFYGRRIGSKRVG